MSAVRLERHTPERLLGIGAGMGGVNVGGGRIALNPGERSVALSTGASLAYDRLVLATGSLALRLPIAGCDLPGVIAFRHLEDVAAMQRARPGTPAVVIGGGLLGIEAAYGLAR